MYQIAVYFFYLFIYLIFAYYRQSSGYLMPDEIYFIESRNDQIQSRYIISSYLSKFFFDYGALYSIAIINFNLLYLTTRRLNFYLQLILILNPITVFLAVSYLRDIYIAIFTFYIMNSLKFNKKIILSFIVLYLMRPLNMLIVFLSRFFLTRSGALTWVIFLMIPLIISFLSYRLGFAEQLYFLGYSNFNPQSTYVLRGDIFQFQGVFEAYGNNGYSAYILNHLTQFFSFPMFANGFIYYGLLITFFTKIIICSYLVLKIISNKNYFDKFIQYQLQYISFFFYVSLIISNESAAMRWYLPSFFILILMTDYISRKSFLVTK